MQALHRRERRTQLPTTRGRKGSNGGSGSGRVNSPYFFIFLYSVTRLTPRSWAARVRLWKRATSLGGVESLLEHRASSEGPTSTTPQDLLRVSVGLEHPDDLIDDLRQALG